MSATTHATDDRSTDAELTDTRLEAYTPTDSGAEIRLRAGEKGGQWVDQVVVTDETETVVVYEGTGLKPCAVYNQMIEPFTTDAGEVRADG